jgi:transcriptional regulator with XRE-family HTH domain
MSETEGRAFFDSRGFFAALDAERSSRRLTWKDVAAQAGISASTLTRMSQGRRPDIDGLATLLAWSGLEAKAFIRSSEPAPSPSTVTRISAELRADTTLSEESQTALEQIVRTAYDQLAARDARDSSTNSTQRRRAAEAP